MMEPMSHKKRWWYFCIFIVLFIVFIPGVILYSTGYRLGEGLTLVKVGGMYIGISDEGTDVFINNVKTKQTSLFKKSILIKNVLPKTYSIRVVKDGFTSWSKNIVVKEYLVTEAYPFLISEHIPQTEISQFISVPLSATSTKTRIVKNPIYTNVLELFTESTKQKTVSPTLSTTSIGVATTSAIANSPVRSKIRLNVDKDSVKADWTGESDPTPFFFCNSVCVPEITAYTGADVRSADFYPGRNDVVIISAGDSVFVRELDMRDHQNSVVVFKGNSPDFRLTSDEKLYVRDGLLIYELKFF